MSDEHLSPLLSRLVQFMEDYSKVMKARDALTAEALALLSELQEKRPSLTHAPSLLTVEMLKALLETRLLQRQGGFTTPTHSQN